MLMTLQRSKTMVELIKLVTLCFILAKSLAGGSVIRGKNDS